MDKSRFLALVSISLLFIAILSSCGNNSKFEGFEMTQDSLYYKYHIQSNDTQTVLANDILSVYFNYRNGDSSFNKSGEAAPIDIQVLESTYPGDVYTALQMMHVGDSMTFALKTKDFFEITVGAPIPEYLDSVEYFFLDVKVDSLKSFKELEAKRLAQNEKLKSLEPEKISTFLNENNITTEPLEGGLIVNHTKVGSGNLIENGNHVDLHYKVKVIDQDWFEDTRARNQTYMHLVGTGRFSEGFDQALLTMKKGGIATIIIPSNLAFGVDGVQGIIPPYSPLVFEVEVVNVLTKEEFEKIQAEEQAKMQAEAEAAVEKERVEMQQYLDDNNIKLAPTASGLYYIENEKGNGIKAEPGKTVTVHYDGYLLDGTKFDSSRDKGQTFEFVLGQGQVIPGWDQAIEYMNIGTKATFIIPSRLAYGTRGSGRIPPNSPLRFEVELIDVK